MKRFILLWSRPISMRVFLMILAGLLVLGSMFLVKGRDPFIRLWLFLKTGNQGTLECVAILPKMAQAPLPVVVYLHGSGGKLLNDGTELRQIAEMGLAVVGMEYNQTNSGEFAEELIALDRYIRQQEWADTNKIAWVGFSLGAQQLLSFLLTHPEKAPDLLVRVGGGWVAGLENSKLKSLNSQAHRQGLVKTESTGQFPSGAVRSGLSVLVVHGELDEVFPSSDAWKVATCLHLMGIPTEVKILKGEGHDFGLNAALIFRAIGEYCLGHFKASNSSINYESMLLWQAEANQAWWYYLPATAWVVFYVTAKRRRKEKLARVRLSETVVRYSAALLTVVAVSETAFHLFFPGVPISDRNLAIARKLFVQLKERSDFDFLSSKAIFHDEPLKVLLSHVSLANYNRELVNWRLDEAVYQNFVLSPEIDPLFDKSIDWRRDLWENFYPRIRKEGSAELAAAVVIRFLRERITVVESHNTSRAIPDVWKAQITDKVGFERVYVAALRSVGVGARLNQNGIASLWTGSEWKEAPRPVLMSLMDAAGP